MDEIDEDTGPGLERTTAFSDGVFAIAITLLVLPLTDAEIDGDNVRESLVALTPSMLTFALSFAVIGRYWVLHHRLLDRLAHADGGLMTLNLAYLFCIAFLPFPTSLLGEQGDSIPATLLYAANLIAVSLAALAVWSYASRRRRLVRADVTAWEIRVRLARTLAPTLALLPSLPLAFVSTDWAKLSWILIAPFSMIADRLYPDEPR
jgi:uncharacterized membrane protein